MLLVPSALEGDDPDGLVFTQEALDVVALLDQTLSDLLVSFLLLVVLIVDEVGSILAS